MNYTSSRLSIDSTRNSFHLPVITDTRRMKTIPCKINILRDNHVNSCNIRANPFAEMTAYIPAGAMQVYVILMFLLVVGGTVLDMIHKKSAKYFFDNAEKAKAVVLAQ